MKSQQGTFCGPRRAVRGAMARRILAASSALVLLAACENGAEMPGFLQKRDTGDAQAATPSNRSVTLVERDVEAPNVFQITEAGLWDGRPSLGGVWVAHPDVNDPERVIIRNPSNGKFVIGALFRKERSNPGPRLQVSSDAASALSLVAGQPTNLNVTALRREETPQDPENAQPGGLDAPDDVIATDLDPIEDLATAAIDDTPAATPPAAPPTPTPAPVTSSLSKPYIQLGIFSIEKNANNTAAAMRSKGLIPTVKKQSSQGKTFWRVIVGPAQSTQERSEILSIIKSAGFADAYAVSS